MRFNLPAIHCSSCIYLLEHLNKLEPAILKSEVNFVKKFATITYKHDSLSMKDLAILLAQLGYSPDLSLDAVNQTKEFVKKSHIGAKIAVAGFCFGNAMLMSMPEYLDRNLLLTDDFKSLFGWINLGLALPVIFYAASDYFTKAWKGLRHKNLNIDVPIALGILTLFGRSFFEIVTGTGPGYVDSLAGLVFFLLIGKWYQGKTYQALSFDRDYSSYFPVAITTLVHGKEIQKNIRELKKGDKVVIHNDELIPADGYVLKGLGNIDYSFVTGESNPEIKQVGQKAFAGGRQKGGELVIELEQSVNTSELTQLWNSDVFKNHEDSLHNWVDRISKYFTLAIIAIALVTGVYWWIVDATKIWNSVTAVLIVACPCALALVLPFAYGHAIRAFGKVGLYLKNAEVVESLARVDTLVFDKTGTLTTNESDISYDGEELDNYQIRLLKSAVGNSAHPLSRLIHQQLPELEKIPITDFNESIGLGFKAILEGNELLVGSSEFVGAKDSGVANQSRVFVRINDHLIGRYLIKASYRNGIFKMLNNLKEQVRMFLLSGDTDGEAERLSPYFESMRFNQKPLDKLSFLQGLRSNTLMIGDGLNDAGALKQADVGIAISEDIHQFSPACDGILSAKQIDKVPWFLSFSNKVIQLVFMAFGISFLYNIVGLSFAMSGHLTPLVSAILMPVSSVTVVGFVTLGVSYFANWLTKTAGGPV